MPTRNNRPRGPEVDVAARIALEREHRGLSAARLARLMTERGCTMNQSAINKIEQGNPPRRITVDELVAFAQVFDLEVEDLLTVAHAAREREVERAYRAAAEAAHQIDVMAIAYERQLDRLVALASIDPTVHERITEAREQCRTAMVRLTAAVESVSDEVLRRLRAQPPTVINEPKPRTSELRLGPTSYERRAAAAAAPPPKSGKSSTSDAGTRRPGKPS